MESWKEAHGIKYTHLELKQFQYNAYPPYSKTEKWTQFLMNHLTAWHKRHPVRKITPYSQFALTLCYIPDPQFITFGNEQALLGCEHLQVCTQRRQKAGEIELNFFSNPDTAAEERGSGMKHPGVLIKEDKGYIFGDWSTLGQSIFLGRQRIPASPSVQLVGSSVFHTLELNSYSMHLLTFKANKTEESEFFQM